MADLTFTQSADPVELVNSTSGNILSVNSDGSLVNSPRDGIKATYSASALNIALAASATDVFTIFGSATKTVRVLKLRASGTQTVAGDSTISLVIRSAANTGGTSASVTKVPHDSTNAAATTTVLSYTANPTGLGAAVGTIRNDKIFIPPTSANAAAVLLPYDFGNGPSQGIVLRGTAQGLCINLNATTLAGGLLNVWVEWTEE